MAVVWRGLFGRRRWWLWGAGSVVAVFGVLVAVVWWPRGFQPPPFRARVYGQFTSCLLTDEHGVNGSPASSVWAGMQEASLATRSKVEYLAVVGPQTADNAKTFVASLAQSRCGLVLAAGSVPVAAVNDSASVFPSVEFVVVGSVASVGNVTVVKVSSDAEIKSQVASLVSAAAASASRR